MYVQAMAAAPGIAAEASPPTARVSEPRGKARLVAAGIDTSTAEWVQQQLDKNQLDELYLQNQASREGWLNTPRYHKQRREIQQRFDALRAELGDETFDRLLYAVGRPNRVLVSDVMQGSPAEQIGLNPNTDSLAKLAELNKSGELIVDCHCRTNIEGLFGAGDITTVPYDQIVISAGEGAKAALAAYDYLVGKGVV